MLLVIPLADFWSLTDWMIRWYQVIAYFLAWEISLTFPQPYIALVEGNVPASRSILLEHASILTRRCPKTDPHFRSPSSKKHHPLYQQRLMSFNSQLLVLLYSLKYKHYLIYISMLTAFMVILLQPLAGSLLLVRQVPYTSS